MAKKKAPKAGAGKHKQPAAGKRKQPGAGKSKRPAAGKAKPKTALKSKPAATTKTKLKSKPATKAKSKAVSKASSSKTVAKGATPAPARSAAKASVARPSARAADTNLAHLFTPLDDRLILEEAAEATRTPGGLYIPDTVSVSDRPRQGRVLAVGRGHRDNKGRVRPLDVQLGDTVLFEPYKGSEIKVGARELIVLRESDILGVIRT